MDLMSKEKWPDWPGYCVFRIFVHVERLGDLAAIWELAHETNSRIRVLKSTCNLPHFLVLISGKDEPQSELSPVMNATIKIFKHVNGLPQNDHGDNAPELGTVCSVRLLVPSNQASRLIGRQGSLIESIRENSGAAICVIGLSSDVKDAYGSSEEEEEERIIKIEGEALKVLKALKAVVGHLRKFLVDASVLPLFERAEKQTLEVMFDSSSFRPTPPQSNTDSLLVATRLNSELYRAHHGCMVVHPSTSRRLEGTKVVETMQLSIGHADNLIGPAGGNIAYIRSHSGAQLSVDGSIGRPEEMTVQIQGTASQVETAKQLIEEFTNGGA